MKHMLLFSIISFTFRLDPPTMPLMPDPAAAYAAFLGYRTVVRKNAGGEYGVCIFPNGSECEEWQFFRGICGKEYSYCSRKGCETYSITEDKGGYKITYCACGCIDSAGIKKTIPLLKFMEQNGDTLIKSKPGRFGKAF